MTTFKRVWWEDGVLHEQDIAPEDFYVTPMKTPEAEGLERYRAAILEMREVINRVTGIALDMLLNAPETAARTNSDFKTVLKTASESEEKPQ